MRQRLSFNSLHTSLSFSLHCCCVSIASSAISSPLLSSASLHVCHLTEGNDSSSSSSNEGRAEREREGKAERGRMVEVGERAQWAAEGASLLLCFCSGEGKKRKRQRKKRAERERERERGDCSRRVEAICSAHLLL